MNQASTTLFLFIFLATTVFAQDIHPNKSKYMSWIYLKNEDYKLKGTLHELKDSSIVFSNSVKNKGYSEEGYKLREYQISNINFIQTRRKRNTALGILLGYCIGASYGYISGANSDGNNIISARSWAAIKAIIFGPIGLGIGFAITINKTPFPIYGKLKNYKKHKRFLYQYAIKGKQD